MAFNIAKHDYYRSFKGTELCEFIERVENNKISAFDNVTKRLGFFDKGEPKKWAHKYNELNACWSIAKTHPDFTFEVSKDIYPDLFINQVPVQVVRVINGEGIKAKASVIDEKKFAGAFTIKEEVIIAGRKRREYQHYSTLQPETATAESLEKIKTAFNKKVETHYKQRHPKDTCLLMKVETDISLFFPENSELREIFRGSPFAQIIIVSEDEVLYSKTKDAYHETNSNIG